MIDFILSMLLACGIGVALATFLSKTLLTQLLKKDIEKYKTKLNIENKLLLEGRTHALKEEINRLHILWELIYEVVSECKNTANTKNKFDLSKKVEKLDIFLSKEKPFINNVIFNLSKQLADFSDPDIYKSENLNELLVIESNLVEKLRELLHLH